MSLFDHLVEVGEHGRRNHKAEGLGSLGVDHQLELGRLLNWKIGRLRALENLVDIVSRAPKQVSNIGPVRHESAGCHKFSNSMERRQLLPGSEFRMRGSSTVISASGRSRLTVSNARSKSSGPRTSKD